VNQFDKRLVHFGMRGSP